MITFSNGSVYKIHIWKKNLYFLFINNKTFEKEIKNHFYNSYKNSKYLGLH